jgi:uncharacterized protein
MKRFVLWVISFCTRRAWIVIGLSILISVVLGFFATRVKMNPDLIGILPENTEANRMIRDYGDGKTPSELLVVAFKGDGLFSLETLSSISAAADALAALPGALSMFSPFNLPSFGLGDGRLDIGKMSADGRAPRDEAEIAAFRERLAKAPYAKSLVTSEDGKMLVIYVQVAKMPEYSSFMKEVDAIVGGVNVPGVGVHVTGTIPLAVRTGYYLSRDLAILVSLAVFVLLVFYYLGFRSKRAVLLAALVTILGCVWAVGFMGLLGFEFTLISIVAPPLILIFGNEYAIYMLNEYYRLGSDKRVSADWIEKAVANVGKPIFMAFVTTITGFLSLCITDIRQTREFAIAASFGSFACGFLALFLLPALLTFFKRPDEDRTRKVIDGPTSRIMAAAASLISRKPKIIAISFTLVLVIFAATVGRLTFNTDSATYFPQGDKVIKDMYAITDEIGGFDTINVTYEAPSGKKFYFLDPAVLGKVAEAEKEFEKNPDVCYTISLPRILEDMNLAVSGTAAIPSNRASIMTLSRVVAMGGGALFGNIANADFTRLTLSFRIYNSATKRFMDEDRFRRFLSFVRSTAAANPVADTPPVIWGDLMRNLELADSLRNNLLVSMVISLGIIFLIATANFRSFKFGLFSVLPVVAGLTLNFAFMAITGIPLDMTTIMVANVTLGVGIDSAIYIIIQYRRDLAARNDDSSLAISHTLHAMGRAVVLSAASIICGLLSFVAAAFKPVQYFGLLIIFSLTATVIGTILLLPSVLKLDHDRKRHKAAA